ncbi:MAG: hypothetical protein IT383_17335 [Deltaproteobacteria bacterium]|nr:hypothetical protein [Deltaproteobacteria bacterium]
MSIVSVMKEVKAAIAGGTAFNPEPLTRPEAQRIIAEAKKGRLTSGETKVIVDTFELPRRAFTMAVGEGPSYRLSAAAAETFNRFFAELGVPVGDSEAAVRTKIQNVIQNVGANLDRHALSTAPKTTNLVATRFYSPGVGGSLETAYVDASKKHFYWSVQNASARLPEKFYGPFPL